MFGKKQELGLAVQHYEGIEQFAKDYPCRLEFNADMLTITRIKPETTVTLPRNRIQSISAMEEPQFMQKYHGNAASTGKGIKKYFLVIHYDKGMHCKGIWSVCKYAVWSDRCTKSHFIVK